LSCKVADTYRQGHSQGLNGGGHGVGREHSYGSGQSARAAPRPGEGGGISCLRVAYGMRGHATRLPKAQRSQHTGHGNARGHSPVTAVRGLNRARSRGRKVGEEWKSEPARWWRLLSSPLHVPDPGHARCSIWCSSSISILQQRAPPHNTPASPITNEETNGEVAYNVARGCSGEHARAVGDWVLTHVFKQAVSHNRCGFTYTMETTCSNVHADTGTDILTFHRRARQGPQTGSRA